MKYLLGALACWIGALLLAATLLWWLSNDTWVHSTSWIAWVANVFQVVGVLLGLLVTFGLGYVGLDLLDEV